MQSIFQDVQRYIAIAQLVAEKSGWQEISLFKYVVSGLRRPTMVKFLLQLAKTPLNGSIAISDPFLGGRAFLLDEWQSRQGFNVWDKNVAHPASLSYISVMINHHKCFAAFLLCVKPIAHVYHSSDLPVLSKLLRCLQLTTITINSCSDGSYRHSDNIGAHQLGNQEHCHQDSLFPQHQWSPQTLERA